MRKNIQLIRQIVLFAPIPAVICTSLSSCFFTGNIAKHSFSKEYVNPTAQSVKYAAAKDSTLYVNYLSKYKKNNSDTLYNFSVAVDSLLHYFDTRNQTTISFSNDAKKEKYKKIYQVWHSGEELPLFGKGLVIQLNDEAINKAGPVNDSEKDYTAKVSMLSNDSLFNYDAVEYSKKDETGLPGKKYDKFIYAMNNSKKHQFNYIVITHERKKKSHLNRLLLLPLSLAADIITFPVQLVIKITRDKLDRPAFFEFPNYIR